MEKEAVTPVNPPRFIQIDTDGVPPDGAPFCGKPHPIV